uniref:Uncharacterized protein n=1 Tax=Romanomermis culicivorax TaxID=13658 RepID=A0A915HQU8_ROMCU
MPRNSLPASSQLSEVLLTLPVLPMSSAVPMANTLDAPG